MGLSFAEKIRLKGIYKTCEFMRLKMIGGHLILTSAINERTKVFDFGGNLGIFSTQMSTLFKCKCYCIEPNPSVFDKIVENNLVEKFNLAISDTNGEMDFILSENPEASSFNKSIASVWGIKNAIKVKTATFARFKGDMTVDLLKVDIEGAELDLFKSMTDDELLLISQITVEFHDFLDIELLPEIKATLNRFKSLGFLVVNYSLKSFADVLLINPRRVKIGAATRFWYFIHRQFRYNG